MKYTDSKNITQFHEFFFLISNRNQGFKTIEEDLLKAFKESGVIDPEWYENPPKGHFQRASRTDKGVSAAKMVVSMRMCKF